MAVQLSAQLFNFVSIIAFIQHHMHLFIIVFLPL